MNSKTRTSLIKALSHCSLRELPPEDNNEDVWIKALALVTKTDGCDYFVDLEKDPLTLRNNVKKDFGAVGAIYRYKAIYPYLYLSQEYMPKFQDKSKEPRVNYLKKMMPDRDCSRLTLKELNDAVIGTAIALQLRHVNSYINYTETDYDGERSIETEVGGYED